MDVLGKSSFSLGAVRMCRTSQVDPTWPALKSAVLAVMVPVAAVAVTEQASVVVVTFRSRSGGNFQTTSVSLQSVSETRNSWYGWTPW